MIAHAQTINKLQSSEIKHVTHCTGCVDNIRPHQLHWDDQWMGTAISCTKYSQMAGLTCIQMASRSALKASSLMHPQSTYDTVLNSYPNRYLNFLKTLNLSVAMKNSFVPLQLSQLKAQHSHCSVNDCVGKPANKTTRTQWSESSSGERKHCSSINWPYPQTFIPVVRTFPSPASKLVTSGYYCVNVGSFQTCSQFFTTTIVVCSTSSVEKTLKDFARVPVLCFLSLLYSSKYQIAE